MGQSLVGTVANHTLWEIELMAVTFAVFAVIVLVARRAAVRRNVRLRRAAGFGYQDHDVLERGLGPAGFGAVSATVTALSAPLAPSFGSPGSRLPATGGPPPTLAPEFSGATDQQLLPSFVVPEGQGDDRGPAPGWVLPPEVAAAVASTGAPTSRAPTSRPPTARPPNRLRDVAATEDRKPSPVLPVQLAGEPPAGTPAAWLPDPSGDPGLLRYWDGAMWTKKTTSGDDRRPGADT